MGRKLFRKLKEEKFKKSSIQFFYLINKLQFVHN